MPVPDRPGDEIDRRHQLLIFRFLRIGHVDAAAVEILLVPVQKGKKLIDQGLAFILIDEMRGVYSVAQHQNFRTAEDT